MKAKMICPHCGTQGKPITLTQGSILVEAILWLMVIIPGLLYSLWRLSSKKKVCPACKQVGMIGVDTPRGKQLLTEIC